MQVSVQRETFEVIFIFTKLFLPSTFKYWGNKKLFRATGVEENILALLLLCNNKLTSSADATFFSASGSVLLSLIMSLPEESCLRYFRQQYLRGKGNERKYNLIIQFSFFICEHKSFPRFEPRSGREKKANRMEIK